MGFIFWRKKVCLLTPPGINMMRKKFLAIEFKPLVATPKIFRPGPMVRLIYDDGKASEWHVYRTKRKPIAIETCAPDEHGRPRFAQLKIG